ncbi:MAG: cytochrome c oxidase assembly protein [Gammaproteobacteria bacterium]|nr:cytochrome c oxidase assembly protein [Gammaproteobacteria bacterium]NNJ72886.1 cytochrome c oxidase assembly protein [Enterobacterales bacterium]
MTSKPNNTIVVKKLLFLVVAMFGFGFAMVPIYDVFCEITGINGKTSNNAAIYQGQEVDEERKITIQFVSVIKRGMPWEFQPEVTEMTVSPGQIYQTSFLAKNVSDNDLTGQAIPSIAPGNAALYLNKTECFCFNEQKLLANQSIEMPLVFFIDKDIPEGVHTLTLSYSLYNITDKQQENAVSAL